MSVISMSAEDEHQIFGTVEPTKGTWYPIETAPTDGVECFLIYGADEDGIMRREVCVYLDGSWTTGSEDIYATHWMPLPEPPK